MAPAAGRAQVDVHEERNEPSRCPGGNPPTRGANGRRESDVGLHAHTGCAQESRAPSRTIDHRAILKAHGLPPARNCPTSWQTFLRAHWGAIAGTDFFTTEEWTWRGLVTFYTVIVINLASRRLQVLGTTPHPDARSCGRSRCGCGAASRVDPRSGCEMERGREGTARGGWDTRRADTV